MVTSPTWLNVQYVDQDSGDVVTTKRKIQNNVLNQYRTSFKLPVTTQAVFGEKVTLTYHSTGLELSVRGHRLLSFAKMMGQQVGRASARYCISLVVEVLLHS